MKKISILLVFYIIVTVAVIYSSFVNKNQQSVSKMENRSLVTLENVNFDNISELLNDQFPIRESIITANLKYEITRGKIIGKLFDNDTYKYVVKEGNFNEINNSGYYVDRTMRVNEERDRLLNNRIWNFEQIFNKYGDKYKLYIYKPFAFEESYWAKDPYNGLYTGDELWNRFISRLNGKYIIKNQEINTIDEYMDEHYKTDHHWNSIGAYRGYFEIIDMINDDFEIIGEPKKIVSIIDNDIDFYGSLSLKVNDMYGCDKFIDYELDDNSKLVTYINGQEGKYGNLDCITNPQNYEKDYYYYEGYYGGNEGIVEYDNTSLSDEYPSVLVFVDSFSNCINEDLARHFKHSYFVDPRQILEPNDASNSSFRLDEFLKEYDVDAILWLQYYESLYFDSRMYLHVD